MSDAISGTLCGTGGMKFKDIFAGASTDDKKKIGTRIEGVEVFATRKIDEFIAANSIDQVIFTIQQPDEENQQRVVNYCLKQDIKEVYYNPLHADT